jgi:hypothetical protein
MHLARYPDKIVKHPKGFFARDETRINHATPGNKIVQTSENPTPPFSKEIQRDDISKHKAIITRVIMATVFRDHKTALVVDFIYCFATVTAQNYCGTLEKTRQTIRCKWPGLLRQGVIIVNANAKPLSANRTCNWLRRATSGTLLTLATGPTLRLVISISWDLLRSKVWQANLQKTPT